jgi:hypothetical protein
MFDESDEPTESSYEFIGYRVATDCDDPVDEYGCHVTHSSLYQDKGGLLHYCYFRTAAYHRAGKLNLAVPNIT